MAAAFLVKTDLPIKSSVDRRCGMAEARMPAPDLQIPQTRNNGLNLLISSVFSSPYLTPDREQSIRAKLETSSGEAKEPKLSLLATKSEAKSERY